jgi:hypothetical protein
MLEPRRRRVERHQRPERVEQDHGGVTLRIGHDAPSSLAAA